MADNLFDDAIKRISLDLPTGEEGDSGPEAQGNFREGFPVPNCCMP